jgi:ankyrin repeat protein
MRVHWSHLIVAIVLALGMGASHGGSTANEALVEALEREDLGAAERLIGRGADIDTTRGDGKTLLILAAKKSRPGLVRALIGAGAHVDLATNNGGTALMFAAIGGDIDSVQALVDAGADVNAIGGFDWTALMVATVKGHDAIIRLLIGAGADANLADIYDWTPLMRAADVGRRSAVQALLEWPRVDVEARNDQGATALHRAAAEGNLEIVRLLLDFGVDPMPRDLAGRTPLSLAHAGGHQRVAELLEVSKP